MEEDIKILKKIQEGFSSYNDFMVMEAGDRQIQAIENILNRLEQDERVIKEMAKAWKQDDIRGIEEIIEYFRKKCE